EVDQVLDALEGAGELAGAAADDAVDWVALGVLALDVARQRRVQWAWAVGGEVERDGVLRPLLGNDGDDLRDDVAGALDDDGVADPDVLAGDLVGVVQGGVLDDDAADGDRRQPRDWGDGAGAADLQVDGVEDRARLLGRELAGDRPARRARDEAEPLLPVEAVDLVDDAVNVEREVWAPALELGVGLQQALGALDALRLRRHLEAPPLQRLQRLPLRGGERRADEAPGVGEEVQVALGGDLRVELAQRAGGGVARVDVGRLAGGLHRRVQRGEVGVFEVDLAADLDDLRPAVAGEAMRNLANGLQVGGDVLAHPPVAARGALHEDALLVAQRGRETVDLRLGGVGDRVVAEAQETADTGVELARLVVREGVVERQHRHAVLDRGEGRRPRRADLQRGRVLANEVREARLDRRVALLERIVGGVRDRRRF